MLVALAVMWRRRRGTSLFETDAVTNETILHAIQYSSSNESAMHGNVSAPAAADLSRQLAKKKKERKETQMKVEEEEEEKRSDEQNGNEKTNS
jgi:hypothetical protein